MGFVDSEGGVADAEGFVAAPEEGGCGFWGVEVGEGADEGGEAEGEEGVVGF